MTDFTINETMVFVYRIPTQLSYGYCSGGGKPILFVNVDWFNGIDNMTREILEKEVKKKLYIKPGKHYLVMSPENDISFTFVGEPK